MKRVLLTILMILSLSVSGCSFFGESAQRAIETGIANFEKAEIDSHFTHVDMELNIDVQREPERATLSIEQSTDSIVFTYNKDAEFFSMIHINTLEDQTFYRVQPFRDAFFIQSATADIIRSQAVNKSTEPHYVNQLIMDNVFLIKDLKLPDDATYKHLKGDAYQVTYPVLSLVLNNPQFWQYVSLGMAVEQDLSEGVVTITHSFDDTNDLLISTLHIGPFKVDNVKNLLLVVDITQSVNFMTQASVDGVDWDRYIAYPAGAVTDPLVIIDSEGTSRLMVMANTVNYFGVHFEAGTYQFTGERCSGDISDFLYYQVLDNDFFPLKGNGTYVIEEAGDYILKFTDRRPHIERISLTIEKIA